VLRVAGNSRSGAKKQPVETRLARGTISAEKVTFVPEVVADAVVPEPPRPLGAVGQGQWERLWTHGGPWLKLADIDLVAVVCEQADERQRLRVLYLEEPLENWRAGVMARKLEELMVRSLSDLGFSPVARASMNLAVVETVATVQRIMEAPAPHPMTL
jgi:hypothetical protein